MKVICIKELIPEDLIELPHCLPPIKNEVYNVLETIIVNPTEWTCGELIGYSIAELSPKIVYSSHLFRELEDQSESLNKKTERKEPINF